MVQVLHRYHNSYPFGLDKLSQNTFLIIFKENLSEQQISLYRQKCKILKGLSSSTFIKLQKMLKEENSIHLQFEYFPLSLEKYIQAVKNQGHSSRQRCKALICDFNTSIDAVIDDLVKHEVKADVFLSNIVVVPKEKGGMQLKIFIEPQCEILSLIQHDYKAKEGKRKDRASNNQQYLHQFYEAERKRLNIQFQELLEQYFGKIQQIEKKQMPNFVINGTKLTFISPEKEETVVKQTKMEPPKTRDTKQRMDKKLEENKKINQQVEQKLQNMTPTLKNRQQQAPAPVVAVESKKGKVQKIVNFDQSFEPEFKPEQFTNQNTYILEQNDYLESLEQQLVKLASDKKLTKQHPSKTATHSTEKKEETSTNDDKKITNDSQKSIESQKQVNKSNSQNNSNNNINQNSNSHIKPNFHQNQNNSNTSNNSNQPECLEICKIEPKETAIIEEKVFKYKMKIITSHQIEIEGDGEPNVEEIEREIMEGIKTGKLNINDLASQKKSSQNKSNQANTSNQNSKDSKQMSGSTHTQKSANVGNFLKEAKDKIVQSSHEGTKKEFHQPQPQTQQQQILQTRSSDLQQPKMRSINEIIERIGINKANQIHANQLKEAKLAAFKESSSSHHNEQPQVPTIHSNTTPHYKSEKIQMAEQKVEKADNYLTKIKYAKEKAQLILKQYTKKKQ